MPTPQSLSSWTNPLCPPLCPAPSDSLYRVDIPIPLLAGRRLVIEICCHQLAGGFVTFDFAVVDLPYRRYISIKIELGEETNCSLPALVRTPSASQSPSAFVSWNPTTHEISTHVVYFAKEDKNSHHQHWNASHWQVHVHLPSHLLHQAFPHMTLFSPTEPWRWVYQPVYLPDQL